MGFFSKKKDKTQQSESPAPTQQAQAPPPRNQGDDRDDASRAALFGKASKNPAPAQNPYASAPPAKSGYDSGSYGGGGYGDDRKSPAAGGYGSQGKYGSGGYGGRAGDANSVADSGYAPSSRGGYGSYGARPGVERADSQSTEAGKQQLFGGARERAQEREQQGYGSYGQRPDRGDRELTAEEEEDEDVEAIKQEIRFVKQESVASTRNALRAAAAAEESGRDSLARLGTQGDRIFNTEKNLDLAESANRTAEEGARELKTLNRSMFAVHVKNPFNSAKRNQEREAAILERHDMEQATRDATRQFGYDSKSHVEKALAQPQPSTYGRSQRSMAERSKYQFEADDSDEEKEREIEDNLDQISAVTGRLKNLAMATGEELDRQNKQINRVMEKSDKVHRGVHLNTERIKRIK